MPLCGQSARKALAKFANFLVLVFDFAQGYVSDLVLCHESEIPEIRWDCPAVQKLNQAASEAMAPCTRPETAYQRNSILSKEQGKAFGSLFD